MNDGIFYIIRDRRDGDIYTGFPPGSTPKLYLSENRARQALKSMSLWEPEHMDIVRVKLTEMK